ncbi:hypothetical protein C0992_003556 [Termitomyces sp. T32_za158]|nr:hypothetical protein C0992_003556 [Termitomyces sp. T32_za158]
MQVTYGYQVTSDNDPFLAFSRDTNEAMIRSGPPGATPPDLFPFCTAAPSLVATELELKQRLGPDYLNSDEDIMGAAAVIFAAGAGTTWSAISTFIYAMLAFPACQSKAQQEINSVIGSERLPEFEDRKDLPYVEAVLKETLRWHAAVPLGIPHRCTEDDVYRGMLIPKGSLVISNIRAINLDDNVHVDPHTFNPARFLPKPEGNEEPHPTETFGFGRRQVLITLLSAGLPIHPAITFRICAGRHLADTSIWIAIASILTAFNIKRSIREDGTEIIPDISVPFRSGLSSHPPTLPCNILPRSQKARSLILEANDI